MEPARQDATRAHFSLWDTICIIVGIIIGVGIFRTPGAIFSLCSGPWQALAIWVLAGVLCFVGALCFAELASTYPHSGGEYIYLTRAFGPWAGFLFAWGQLLFVRTGASMVAVAYVFADYTVRLAQLDRDAPGLPVIYVALTLLPIFVLTLINIVGLRTGKWTQNTLTVVKVLGLGGVLVAGFVWARSRAPEDEYLAYEGQVIEARPNSILLQTAEFPGGRRFPLTATTKISVDGQVKRPSGESFTAPDVVNLRARVLAKVGAPTQAVRIRATTTSAFGALSLALIFVLWTYSGWNEGAYIAAEVRCQQRNLPLALLLATGVVMALYLLTNVAYLVGLGFEDAADSPVVAADVLALVPWRFGQEAMCVLVMISSLGAINGTVFTSSRIFAVFGKDHSLFAPLGRWNVRLGTPVAALVVQAVVCVLTVALVAGVFQVHNQESFDELVAATGAVFWVYFLLTGVALFVLRRQDRAVKRPFVAPLYPLTPLIYCGFCGLMLWGSVVAKPWETIACFGVLLLGVPLYWMSKHTRPRRHGAPEHFDSRKVPTGVGE